jgi:hypothetical protein
MTTREMRKAGLSSYQISEVRRMERDGWTVGPITRVREDWATIEVRKGDYHTKAGFAASKRLEQEVTREATRG